MTTKGKHLTLHDRHYIEDALNVGYSLASIARYLGKDPTTISKEIRRSKVVSGKVKSAGHLTVIVNTICPCLAHKLCH